YMEEAEKLCSRVAIIDYGKIKVIDTPSRLKSALEGDVISVVTDKPDELTGKLTEMEFSVEKDSVKSTLRLTVKDAEKLVPRLIEIARKIGAEISSVSIHHPTLNDVFLKYTGRDIRDDEAESIARVYMRSINRNR
ncbi:DUF4162 domain-containing protein, partial [Chloroflexota bacterium]